MSLYKIRKATRPGNVTIGYLSPNKRGWLPLNSIKYKIGFFTEEETNDFIRQHENDLKYYYFKTLV